ENQRNAHPGWPHRRCTDDLAAVADEERRKERDQKAVRVVGDGVPVVDKLDADAVINGNQEKADDRVGQPVADGEWSLRLARSWGWRKWCGLSAVAAHFV